MPPPVSSTVEQYRSAVLTTANQLTILRIIFIPIFIILLSEGESGWALSVFCAAVVTDVLDGVIARRFGQKTSIGTVLDPVADKLLMTASIVILSVSAGIVLLVIFFPQAIATLMADWLP